MLLENYNEFEKIVSSIEENKLIRIVYVSTVLKDSLLHSVLYDQIGVHSERYNREHHVRGILCNDNKYFLQCLEGQKKHLLPLMYNIFKDKRHCQVKVLLSKRIDKYSFMDWRMRSFNLDKNTWSQDAVQLKNPELLEFLPFEPLGWNDWFIEHFLESMQKFDNPEQDYYSFCEIYNVIQDPNVKVTTFFDNFLIQGLLFLLLVILVVDVIIFLFLYF